MTQDAQPNPLVTGATDPPEALLLAWVRRLEVVRQIDLVRLQQRSASVISRQVNRLIQQGRLQRHRLALGQLGRPVDFFTLPDTPPPSPEQIATLDERLAMLLRGGSHASPTATTEKRHDKPVDQGLTMVVPVSTTEAQPPHPPLPETVNAPGALVTPELQLAILPADHVPAERSPTPVAGAARDLAREADAGAERGAGADRDPAREEGGVSEQVAQPGTVSPPRFTLPLPSWSDIRMRRAAWYRTVARATHAWFQDRHDHPIAQAILHVAGWGSLIAAGIAMSLVIVQVVDIRKPLADFLFPDITTVMPTPRVPPTPVVTPTPETRQCAIVSGTGGQGVVVRETPAGKRRGALPEGTVVEVTGGPQTIANAQHPHWLPVRHAHLTGWSSDTYLRPTECEATP